VAIQNDLTAQPGEAALINVNRDLRGAVVEITNSNSEPEVSGISSSQPSCSFLTASAALKAKGINEHADISKYTQITDTVTVPASSVVHELAAVESPPLSQLLVETNQNSNNLYAELLRTLGALVKRSLGTVRQYTSPHRFD